MRIGQGFDAHRLEPGRPLRLGGIEVPHERGLAGHSDGDVLLHAVTSALLGALGEGDLGRHFPSSDPALEGVASRRLLSQVVERGLAGHSDGDVLLHAVASALLGALGEGDLGRHFPSSDPALEGIASGELLSQVVERVRGAGWAVGNVDATIVAQAPRLAPYLAQMEAVIADLLGIGIEAVNVKVTSTDGLGTLGRAEGIAALAVALLVSAGEGV